MRRRRSMLLLAVLQVVLAACVASHGALAQERHTRSQAALLSRMHPHHDHHRPQGRNSAGGEFLRAGGGLKLLVVTAINQYPCGTVAGNYINMLTLKNKQDYAQLHGYGMYFSTGQVEANMTGPWNKVALLRSLLHSYRSARRIEWFLSVDNDTLFAKLDKVLDWQRYDGHDMVLWADRDKVVTDKDANGANTGVLLLRNSEWTRSLIDQWAALGVDWGRGGNTEAGQRTAAELRGWHPDLFDQAGLIYLLATRPDLAARTYFEDVSSGFQMHYQHNMPLDKVGEWPLPLTLHYAGCQFCSYGQVFDDNKAAHCVRHFLTIYGLADDQSAQLLGDGILPFNASKAYHALAEHDEQLRGRWDAVGKAAPPPPPHS